MVRALGHISARMLARTVEHGSMRILPEGAKASVLRLLEDREVQGDVAYQLGHTRVAHAEGSGVMESVVGHTMSMHNDVTNTTTTTRPTLRVTRQPSRAMARPLPLALASE